MSKIAFLGLGMMGTPMATRLLGEAPTGQHQVKEPTETGGTGRYSSYISQGA